MFRSHKQQNKYVSCAVVFALPVGALQLYAFPPYNLILIGFLPYLYVYIAAKYLTLSRLAIVSLLLGCGCFFHGMYWVYDFGSWVDLEFRNSVALVNTGILFLLALFGFVLPALFTRWSSARVGQQYFPFIFTLCFTLFEWVRSTIFTGLPYFQPGYLLIDTPYAPLAQMSGVLLLTLIFYALIASTASVVLMEKKRGAAGLLGVCLLLGVVAQWVQPLSDDQQQVKASFVVRLIQGQETNQEKESIHGASDRVTQYLDWSTQSGEMGYPTVVIWPEGSVQPGGGHYRKIFEQLELLEAQGTSLLFGSYTELYQQQFNALTGGPDLSVLYRKSHLIPFGEYTPDLPIPFLNLGNHLPEVKYNSLSEGVANQPPAAIAGYRFRTAICFEIMFGDELRQAGEPYDFLVHVSDLSWFEDTPVADHMLHMARMRALETGKPVLRATNMGVSTAIDPQGRVYAQVNRGEEGFIDARVTPQMGVTLYMKYGVTPLLAFMLISLLLIISTRFLRTKQPIKQPNPYIGMEKPYEH